MSDRSAEIQRFFFLLLRLCALVFGYLMIAGGGLFALAFVFERLRTGAIAVNGAVHTDGLTQFWLVALPIAIALGGAVLVLFSRRKSGSAS